VKVRHEVVDTEVLRLETGLPTAVSECRLRHARARVDLCAEYIGLVVSDNYTWTFMFHHFGLKLLF